MDRQPAGLKQRRQRVHQAIDTQGAITRSNPVFVPSPIPASWTPQVSITLPTANTSYVLTL